MITTHSSIRRSRCQGLSGFFPLLIAMLMAKHATAEVVSIANATVSISASGGPEPGTASVSSDHYQANQVQIYSALVEGTWGVNRQEREPFYSTSTWARLEQTGAIYPQAGTYSHWWSSYVQYSFEELLPYLVYTPFVSTSSPFADMPVHDAYIYKVGYVALGISGAATENVSFGYSYDLQMTCAIQSVAGLSRVFMTVFGAPTPSGEAVVYDSGTLGSVNSATITWQEDYPSSFSVSRVSEYGVYAVVPVPEPSTYAMAIAGLACGGYSIWRRRKQACRNSLSMISTRGEQAAITGLCFGRSIHPRLPHNSPHPTRPFRSRMSSTPRLLRSAFICGSFSLILFGSASSQAEIMFSDKLVSGRLSGLTGGSHNGIWDNEPVDQSYGPSEGFSEQGAGFYGRGYGIEAFFSGSPTMIYSPFVNVERPFPEIGTDMQYVYKMGTLNFAAYQHFPGGTWTWEFNGSYTIASDEPMSRVFVTVFGAPTPSGEAVVRDSGELGGAFSNSGSYDLTVQTADILYNGSWQIAEYGIYAVVPVPEPSTYTMALAGLTCGGYLVRRRRKRA